MLDQTASIEQDIKSRTSILLNDGDAIHTRRSLQLFE